MRELVSPKTPPQRLPPTSHNDLTGGIHNTRALVAANQFAVLPDSSIQINPGLVHQAALQLADEDVHLAPGGPPRRATGPREPIPGPGEREEVRASSAPVCREHRANTAVAIDVCTGDDPLVASNPVEHRLARGHGQAVDRQTQILDEPAGGITTNCHRLWFAACALRLRRDAQAYGTRLSLATKASR
jgi:hypothetical protein